MQTTVNSARKKLLHLIPPRNSVPVDLRVLKTENLTFGRRTAIEYSVSPRERVRAFLLCPERLPRRTPAILALHQHNGEWHLGKSEPAGLSGDPSMHYGIELCRQGYIVLCPDHLGFEDRQAGSFPKGHPTPLVGRAYEEFIFADQLLHGSSLAAKYTHDLCQALDVLESLPDVDSKRLGVLGHSLGGQTAAWLAFFDRRVKVAFASCGFSTLATVQKHRLLHNLAAYVPGLFQVGDIDDVIAAIAPRAFGMSHGTKDDIFPMEGVRRITRKARGVFPKERLLTIQFAGPHEFPKAVKERAYRFLARHLRASSV